MDGLSWSHYMLLALDPSSMNYTKSEMLGRAQDLNPPEFANNYL